MQKQTDYLIIGAGIAGLTAALHLSKVGHVVVLTKGKAHNANTYWAQGGVAGVIGKQDSFESHIEDTLKVGVGHCDEAAVRQMVVGAPKAFQFLQSIGLEIESEPFMEAGHSQSRVWRSSDFTGRDVLGVLLKAAQRNRSIKIIEKHEAAELIVHADQCLGAFTRPSDSNTTSLKPYFAKQTILATGGLGQLYHKTSNALGAGGDGLALAVNAGLDLQDVEFVQFHPTALALPKNGRHLLLSETLRGMGAKILNQHQEQFLSHFDKRAELAPRDIVSRAVFIEEMHGPVYLDMRHIDSNHVEKKFPNIFEALTAYDLNLAKDLIPITPVAHYACGGVPVDLHSATGLSRLYALGEVARTGVHGANRLASNSLLESLVFAKVMADHLAKKFGADQLNASDLEMVETPAVVLESIDQVKAYSARIGKIMWEHVGILRSKNSLEKAKKEISKLPARDYRIQHRQIAAYKIILACLARSESLGTHFMSKDID